MSHACYLVLDGQLFVPQLWKACELLQGYQLGTVPTLGTVKYDTQYMRQGRTTCEHLPAREYKYN